MKKLTKNELAIKAVQLFKDTNAKKLHATHDGYFFTDEELAKQNAKNIESEVYTFTPDSVDEAREIEMIDLDNMNRPMLEAYIAELDLNITVNDEMTDEDIRTAIKSGIGDPGVEGQSDPEPVADPDPEPLADPQPDPEPLADPQPDPEPLADPQPDPEPPVANKKNIKPKRSGQ